MIKIKEKRMQSYVLRARKMVQEGKNKEGAEMLSEGLNYYSKNIIKALTPYATADAGIISMVLRNLADGIEKDRKTEICPDCGTKQALDTVRDLLGPEMTDQQWEGYKSGFLKRSREGQHGQNTL